jgi:hypothetical protein
MSDEGTGIAFLGAIVLGPIICVGSLIAGIYGTFWLFRALVRLIF